MTFVSYAQNFEDVVLWRALKHVEIGFYVDVGAWSPDVDSVTRAFYERGWNGINIEPDAVLHSTLVKRRPMDANLRVAVSDHEGEMSINIFPGTGLSTLNDSVASAHVKQGRVADRQLIPVTTLGTIWEAHDLASRDVHFLKVDVEGYEETVLRGADWNVCRPWIIVVEATMPLSQVESHCAWDPLIRSAGYEFAYADGLNRFYVAAEHSEILQAFRYPPNVFDNFVSIRECIAVEKSVHADFRAEKFEHKFMEAAAALNKVHQSSSWKITKPLRKLNSVVNGICKYVWSSGRGRGGVFGLEAARLFKLAASFASKNPVAKARLLALISKFPSLEARISRVARSNARIPASIFEKGPTDCITLAKTERLVDSIVANILRAKEKNETVVRPSSPANRQR